MSEINDTVSVKLPSGRTAIIRNYTTYADDLQSSRILEEGMRIEMTVDGDKKVIMSGEAASASERKYVELLTQTIDGAPATADTLQALRSADYAALSAEVAKITRASLKG